MLYSHLLYKVFIRNLGAILNRRTTIKSNISRR